VSVTNQPIDLAHLYRVFQATSVLFHDYALLRFRRRWLLLAPLKTGRFKHNCDYRHPVSISSSSYFSFTLLIYECGCIHRNWRLCIRKRDIRNFMQQSTQRNLGGGERLNLYNSSLNWLSNSGNYNSSGTYIGTTSTFSSSMTISEYIGIITVWTRIERI
jgi:hypothetical protein